ncbi:MAG: response regulator [Pirellulales bacterium]
MKHAQPIYNSFAYHNLTAALPTGALCCVVSLAILLAVPEPSLLPLRLTVFGIGISYLALGRWALPYVATASQLNRLALIAMSAAATGTFVGAFTFEPDSPVSIALVAVLGAFAFTSHSAYIAFVFYCIGGHCLARYQSGFGMSVDNLHLVISTPVFCVIARVSVTYMHRSELASRGELESRLVELNAERVRRVRSEKQLVHAQKMEGLGLVAAGVAHDFNNHLQAISMLAELVAGGIDAKGNALQIQSVAMDASKICRQMLAYAGKSQEMLTVLDLRKLIEEQRRLVRMRLPGRVELVFDLQPVSAPISANPAGIQQCLINLVKNAAEACEGTGQGKIVVSVTTESMTCSSSDAWSVFGEPFAADEVVVLDVSDAGCGMDSATLERAFDPYFSTKATGHGFGLATTLGIVRTYGGMIRVRTAVGEGSRFQLCFPKATREAASESREGSEVSTLPQRVLLVDDEESVRQSVTRMLTMNGCEVSCAASAQDALDILEKEPATFDLMLVDYSMPEMSGVEFIEKARNRGHVSKAVICTGYAEDSVAIAGKLPAAVLTKPFRISDLGRVLKVAG